MLLCTNSVCSLYIQKLLGQKIRFVYHLCVLNIIPVVIMFPLSCNVGGVQKAGLKHQRPDTFSTFNSP